MAGVTQDNLRAYETIFILRPSLADEDAVSEIEKVKATIAQKAGEIVWVENMGRKKLAYEIQKERRGIFILIHFKGSQKTVFELQRIWRLQEVIMRFMMVKIRLQDLGASSGAGGKPPLTSVDAHSTPRAEVVNNG